MGINIGIQPQDWRTYSQSLLGNLPDMNAAATGVQNAVASPSAIDFAAPTFQTAIMRQLEGPSAAENAASRSAIGQQFNAAVGNIASQGARGGFYNAGAVAQQAMRRPAASLANAYQQLEADRRRMLREGAAGVGNQLQSSMGTVTGREDVAAKARGDLIGQYQVMDANRRALSNTARPVGTPNVGGGYY